MLIHINEAVKVLQIPLMDKATLDLVISEIAPHLNIHQISKLIFSFTPDNTLPIPVATEVLDEVSYSFFLK